MSPESLRITPVSVFLPRPHCLCLYIHILRLLTPTAVSHLHKVSPEGDCVLILVLSLKLPPHFVSFIYSFCIDFSFSLFKPFCIAALGWLKNCWVHHIVRYACNAETRFALLGRKILGEEWHPHFLPGESHGQSNLRLIHGVTVGTWRETQQNLIYNSHLKVAVQQSDQNLYKCQAERRQIIAYLHLWNLKIKTNGCNKTETDSREWTSGHHWGRSRERRDRGRRVRTDWGLALL